MNKAKYVTMKVTIKDLWVETFHILLLFFCSRSPPRNESLSSTGNCIAGSRMKSTGKEPMLLLPDLHLIVIVELSTQK